MAVWLFVLFFWYLTQFHVLGFFISTIIIYYLLFSTLFLSIYIFLFFSSLVWVTRFGRGLNRWAMDGLGAFASFVLGWVGGFRLYRLVFNQTNLVLYLRFAVLVPKR